VIQADAFSGYEKLTRSVGPPRIVHAACWAHARRHLYDEFEKTKSPIAAEALKRIGQLYEIEAAITGKTVEQRLASRQEQTVPVLEELKQWFETQQRRLSAKSTLSKAIQYALSRWDSLTLYAADGRIGIDNNPAERSLRGIAIARSFCPHRARGRGPLSLASALRASCPASRDEAVRRRSGRLP